MFDITIIIAVALSGMAIGFGLEYYRRIIRVKSEYEKVKAAFNDMLLSYSRELKRVVESVEKIIVRVEASSTRSEEALNKARGIEDKVKVLEEKVGKPAEKLNEIVSRLDNLEKQVCDITTSYKELLSKVSSLEEKSRQAQIIPESGIEAVIPIKREKALAHLTDTELAVLEMLASEGPKTAPEIKDRIKLSREHTARLMKKLYEEGYLERDASKIPFKYSVKKEMEKLLKKPETEAL